VSNWLGSSDVICERESERSIKTTSENLRRNSCICTPHIICPAITLVDHNGLISPNKIISSKYFGYSSQNNNPCPDPCHH